MSEWIAFNEQMPETDQLVWVCTAGDKAACDRPFRYRGGPEHEFTHWQPISPPPGEVPSAPELSTKELVAMLLDAIDDARQLTLMTSRPDPANLYVNGVPVVRRLREYVNADG